MFVANWEINNRQLYKRKYLDPKNNTLTFINPNTGENYTGKSLPAHNKVDNISRDKNEHKAKIQSLKIFSTLPQPFLKKLYEISLSKEPITFPGMRQNKSPTVGTIIANSTYNKALDLTKWTELGWRSEEEYAAWLDTPMLFAFSGLAHYCESPRVFDFDHREEQEGTEDVFHLLADNSNKVTPILSVAGFEYRNYKGNIESTREGVKNYSEQIMQLILASANKTRKTDIVLIPFGMGVFLTDDQKELKNNMIAGWINAINNYQGPPITIHCCLLPGQFDELFKQNSNKNITLQNKQGIDAYALTNAINDANDNKQAFMVNAGDHDWIALLKKDHKPGQCGRNHTLFHTTSDEYLSLMTLFELFSVQDAIELGLEPNNFIESIHRDDVLISAIARDLDALTDSVYAEKNSQTLQSIKAEFAVLNTKSEQLASMDPLTNPIETILELLKVIQKIKNNLNIKDAINKSLQALMADESFKISSNYLNNSAKLTEITTKLNELDSTDESKCTEFLERSISSIQSIMADKTIYEQKWYKLLVEILLNIVTLGLVFGYQACNAHPRPGTFFETSAIVKARELKTQLEQTSFNKATIISN